MIMLTLSFIVIQSCTSLQPPESVSLRNALVDAIKAERKWTTGVHRALQPVTTPDALPEMRAWFDTGVDLTLQNHHTPLAWRIPNGAHITLIAADEMNRISGTSIKLEYRGFKYLHLSQTIASFPDYWGASQKWPIELLTSKIEANGQTRDYAKAMVDDAVAELGRLPTNTLLKKYLMFDERQPSNVTNTLSTVEDALICFLRTYGSGFEPIAPAITFAIPEWTVYMIPVEINPLGGDDRKQVRYQVVQVDAGGSATASTLLAPVTDLADQAPVQFLAHLLRANDQER